MSETVTWVFTANSVWKETISGNQVKPTERTLKTWRILSRSDFQAEIASWSSFAWKSLETAFR